MEKKKYNKNIRIIPRLDVKGPNLVKGIHLEGLRVLGKPEDFAERYYREGADELIYIDTVASLNDTSDTLKLFDKDNIEIINPKTDAEVSAPAIAAITAIKKNIVYSTMYIKTAKKPETFIPNQLPEIKL